MKNTDICKRPIIDPESIATFILTSGTTGRIIPRNKSH
jgi:acyl-CoA synthetase (AMP-forming)/AMP-acid ligase II